MNCQTIFPTSMASLAKLIRLGGLHQSKVRNWSLELSLPQMVPLRSNHLELS